MLTLKVSAQFLLNGQTSAGASIGELHGAGWSFAGSYPWLKVVLQTPKNALHSQ